MRDGVRGVCRFRLVEALSLVQLDGLRVKVVSSLHQRRYLCRRHKKQSCETERAERPGRLDTTSALRTSTLKLLSCIKEARQSVTI